MRLYAKQLTVEYDVLEQMDALVLAPFPSKPNAERMEIVGSLDELREVADTINGMLDSFDSGS